MKDLTRVLIQFKSEDDLDLGPPLDVETDISVSNLQSLCNKLSDTDENQIFNFYINKDVPIHDNLRDSYAISKGNENIIDIYFYPQSSIRIYPVTRCTSSLPGHESAILSVQFSPDSKMLATGSGDHTVRFWDLETQTPFYTCQGHDSWVLCIAWSPDAQILASADKNGKVCLWNSDTGKLLGKAIQAHTQWVNSICWEPMHTNPQCRRFVTASKDSVLKIWDSVTRLCTLCLSGHKGSVTCAKWGATSYIYSASQDRTIKIWSSIDGSLIRTLSNHAHWVNSLALSTDYIMRTSCFDFVNNHTLKTKQNYSQLTPEQRGKLAQERFDKLNKNSSERFVSASDDFTLCLWKTAIDVKETTTPIPSSEKGSVLFLICKMTGHAQTVNQVQFSPDGLLIASASFDKSIKIWHGVTGKFLFTLRGHVQRVYQLSFSNDSRLLISGSADSTLKIWKLSGGPINKKGNKTENNTSGQTKHSKPPPIQKPDSYLMVDLPGHADEVYAIDWSPDGSTVASGGKDKILKIWKK